MNPNSIISPIDCPDIAVCGLSCRLCPKYQSNAAGRCHGCKTEPTMLVGCAFLTCALTKHGVEFCVACDENETCERWRTRREAGKIGDSFVCYQRLEDNIAFLRQHGAAEFREQQIARESLLKEMLAEYNEGRSRTFYCVAATVCDVEELRDVLAQAARDSQGMDTREKSRLLHSLLENIAQTKGYCLKLRKPTQSSG